MARPSMRVADGSPIIISTLFISHLNIEPRHAIVNSEDARFFGKKALDSTHTNKP